MSLIRRLWRKWLRNAIFPQTTLSTGLLMRLMEKFKVSYSVTGTALEQFEKYSPAVLKSFSELADTGAVELLSETYYHSLSFLFSKEEFMSQISMHKARIHGAFQ
jgi:alpha-amylase